jgi:uncharacterized membrane protein SpoIIM required for sporulation
MGELIKIKAITPYVLLATFIFFMMLLIGYFVGVYDQAGAYETLDSYKENQATPIMKQAKIVQMLIVFIGNALVGGSIMLAGSILASKPFGISFGSVFALSYNGYVIGNMCSVFVAMFGAPIVILSMLPHAVFELSAIFVCAGIGLFMGNTITKERKKNNDYNPKPLEKESIRIYFTILVPVFLLAAIIEMYISVYLFK